MARKFSLSLIAALLLPIAACDVGTGANGPGTLSLLLTDAPGDFQNAWVTLERVELVGGGEGAVVLRDEAVTTDLLTLQNDVAVLVDDLVIPEGLYSQLRFVVSGGCIVVEGDSGEPKVYASSGYAGLAGSEDDACESPDGNLQMPSFSQSGIKVNLPGGAIAVAGDHHIILVDFDVAQSFGRQAGNSGQWVMHPVIRADAVYGAVTVALTLADTVTLPEVDPDGEGGNDPRPATLGDFQARLAFGPDDDLDGEPDSQETLVLTDSDGDGIFSATFLYLVAGEGYEASVELMDGVTFDFILDPVAPQTVNVGNWENVSVTFEVTAAAVPTT